MRRPARVLVVDDDPDFLESMKAMLESGGYQVAVAPGEEEARTEMAAERPDVLILDVMMAKWDSGFKFLWELRSDRQYKDIPVLMVTGVDKELHINFASHARSSQPDDQNYLPVDGYLVKPVKSAELLHSIEWVLTHAAAGGDR